MKKILLFSALFITFLTFAQVPQGISYQAIALNSSGTPVVSSNVGIKLSILDSSVSGTVLYSETQLKTTNAQGLFNLTIGQGTLVSGAFNTINWGVNTKFLKVEMDASGGTTYVPVGTTQLLSVPYALAADSLVTSAGEGITLVSPNGTPYQLTVNDDGELSLPTSSQPSNAPTQLYLYGSFNSWNASAALQFSQDPFTGFKGFKYFTAGTQIKFLTAQNTNTIYGGNGLSGGLIQNGNPITIPANGFYKIVCQNNSYSISSINTSLDIHDDYSHNYTMQYYTASNFFYYTYSQSNPNADYRFYVDSTANIDAYGDNLADGIAEVGGANIIIPTVGSKLFKFYLNFDGTGNYTVAESVPSNSYLFGAFQSWNPSLGIQMTNTAPGVFQINYTFASATEIKFATQASWTNTYGGSNGTLETSGSNIPVTAGNHTITVDYGNMTYTIQ
jgi:hypothetical protein